MCVQHIVLKHWSHDLNLGKYDLNPIGLNSRSAQLEPLPCLGMADINKQGRN